MVRASSMEFFPFPDYIPLSFHLILLLYAFLSAICFLPFLNTFLHKIDFKIFGIPLEVFLGACYNFLKTEAFEKCRL